MSDLDRAYVRHVVAETEQRLRAELDQALTAYTATLRAELALEIAEVDQRITQVHDRAIRALTARTNEGGTH